MTAKPASIDSVVLTALVDNHRRFLAFLLKRVGNRADAEEILQSAFVTSVEKVGSIRHGETAVAWFYRLLRNSVVDFYRHRAVERRALKHASYWNLEVEPVEPEVEKAICRCIHDLLPTLNRSYAMLIRRIDLEGASIAKASEENNITVNNARVKLHRARQALRKQLTLSCGTCAEHACLDCDCRSPG